MTQGKRTVLIVDTESSGTEEIRRLLDEDEDRFIVHTAESSARALDTIYDDPPDLVIVNQSLETDDWKEKKVTLYPEPMVVAGVKRVAIRARTVSNG